MLEVKILFYKFDERTNSINVYLLKLNELFARFSKLNKGNKFSSISFKAIRFDLFDVI